MLSYKEFKTKLCIEVESFLMNCDLPTDMYVKTVEMGNQMREALTLISEPTYIPQLYLDEMYETYQKAEDQFGKLAYVVFSLLCKEAAVYEDKMKNQKFAIPKDKIVLQLVETKKYLEMLKDVPHREFLNLSITYIYEQDPKMYGIEGHDDERHIFIIGNNDMQKMGMSEEDLYQLAMENTKRMSPLSIQQMSVINREHIARQGYPEELVEIIAPVMDPEHDIWQFTADEEYNGSAALLYEEKLHEFAEKMQSNLLLLPISMQVIGIVLERYVPDVKELAFLSKTAYEMYSELGESLSDCVYRYDRETRKISMAYEQFIIRM